jgi:hypothetical protein
VVAKLNEDKLAEAEGRPADAMAVDTNGGGQEETKGNGAFEDA